MRSLARYAETNAITRALLSELLTAQDFADLVHAPSSREAWSILGRTSYEALLPDLPESDPLAVDALLRGATAGRFSRGIRALRGKPGMVGEVLLSRWELDDLERALRLWHSKDTGLERHFSSLPSFYAISISDVLAAESIGGVAEALKGTPYPGPVHGSVQAYEAEGSVFYVEVALEKDYYRRLLASLAALGRSDALEAERMVATEVDLLNLSWLARLRRGEAPEKSIRACLIPGPSLLTRRLAGSDLSADTLAEASRQFLGGKNAGEGQGTRDLDQIAFLESMLADMAAGMARRLLGGFPFSITCIVAFYLLTRLELRNLSIVFTGKAIGADEGKIREKLHGLE
jgi:vacuolar-type H+-ATPase subunit C/Vma6